MLVVCLCLFAVFVQRGEDDESPWGTGPRAMLMSLVSYAALVLMYIILWLCVLQFLGEPDAVKGLQYKEMAVAMAKTAVPLVAAVGLVTPLAAVAVPMGSAAVTHAVGVIAVVAAWRLPPPAPG